MMNSEETLLFGKPPESEAATVKGETGNALLVLCREINDRAMIIRGKWVEFIGGALEFKLGASEATVLLFCLLAQKSHGERWRERGRDNR